MEMAQKVRVEATSIDLDQFECRSTAIVNPQSDEWIR